MPGPNTRTLTNKVFSSDNTAGAAPSVLQAIMDAGTHIQQPYGNDGHSKRAQQLLEEIFECSLSVFLVPIGTASNLSALTPPWGPVLCHPQRHINIDEWLHLNFILMEPSWYW
jgi:threonine aldolase